MKHISWECKCRFNEKKCNSDQWRNNDKCWCECKKCHVCKKKYVRNPATCNCENGKYLASFMDDSAITHDEVIESYNEDQKLSRKKKQIFIKRKQPVKCKIFIFYLYFY